MGKQPVTFMKPWYHKSICWLLLATFGVIAGGGRGLHFAPIFGFHSHEHSHEPQGGNCGSEKTATNGRHRHCHSHSHHGHSDHVAKNTTFKNDKAIRQNVGYSEKPALRSACDDHSDCLICQFFFQGCAETACPAPVLQPLLAARLACPLNDVAAISEIALYQARGPPSC